MIWSWQIWSFPLFIYFFPNCAPWWYSFLRVFGQVFGFYSVGGFRTTFPRCTFSLSFLVSSWRVYYSFSSGWGVFPSSFFLIRGLVSGSHFIFFYNENSYPFFIFCFRSMKIQDWIQDLTLFWVFLTSRSQLFCVIKKNLLISILHFLDVAQKDLFEAAFRAYSFLLSFSFVYHHGYKFGGARERWGERE